MKPWPFAEMVQCWSPGSPGSVVVARRRWRKRRPFATLTECIVYADWVLAIEHDTHTDVRWGSP